MKDRIFVLVFVGVVGLFCVGMARLTIDTMELQRAEIEAVAHREADLDAAISRLHGRIIAMQTDIQFIRMAVFQQTLNSQDEAIRQAHRAALGK